MASSLEGLSDQTWLLLLHWVGKKIASTAVHDDGSLQPGPAVSVGGRALTIHAMPAMTPVVLTVDLVHLGSSWDS